MAKKAKKAKSKAKNRKQSESSRKSKPASKTGASPVRSGRATKRDPEMGALRPTVRIYRQGLGDCILVRLPRKDEPDFTLMIDCGVAVATRNASEMMTNVVKNILDTVGTPAKVDVLAVTHEHWDHVSGFQQAADAFGRLGADEVWLAWTEDSKDQLAKKLKKDHAQAFAALSRSAAVRAMSGDPAGGADLLQMAGMLGAAGEKTKAALDIAKAKADPRYLKPTDMPIPVPGTGALIYVLGPPHDEKAIKNFKPSKRNPEVYELALDGSGILGAGVFTALAVGEDVRPFADSYSISVESAQAIPFFQQSYWGTPGDASGWRRIEGDWLGGTDELALMLQAATNNTSLVLAIELEDGDVLLFAGDAQVGNWLSWQDLTWTLPDGRVVTGPDLLARTVFYKVGHHGSHNATLRQQGLEQMKRLKTAVIPVDEVVAKKMRWGAMPLKGLIAVLDDKTGGRTFRTDIDAADGTPQLTADPLFFEFQI